MGGVAAFVGQKRGTITSHFWRCRRRTSCLSYAEQDMLSESLPPGPLGGGRKLLHLLPQRLEMDVRTPPFTNVCQGEIVTSFREMARQAVLLESFVTGDQKRNCGPS